MGRKHIAKLASCLVIGMLAAQGALAQEQEVQARGVNPADNDTRLDVIFKYNWLTNRAGLFTTTLKYDQRLTPELGFNVEMPVFGAFRSPGAIGIPGSGIHESGVGDVFARLRYVQPFGRLSLGGAIETALPTASERVLGTGTYQINVAALGVYAWSPTVISAVVGKAVQSVHAFSGRRDVQENTLRAIQAFILPQARFVTFDVKYNWETINRRDVWWETQVEAGMMVDARTSVSVALSRKFGDRRDRGAATLTAKRFF